MKTNLKNHKISLELTGEEYLEIVELQKTFKSLSEQKNIYEKHMNLLREQNIRIRDNGNLSKMPTKLSVEGNNYIFSYE